MTVYGYTKTGAPIDDALVDRVAREAEAGFEGWQLARRPGGRPPLDGDNPSGTRTFRLPPDLDEALVNRAQADQVTPSEVTRQALREYLKVA